MRIEKTNYFGLHESARIVLSQSDIDTLKKAIAICEKGFELEKVVNEWTDDNHADSDFSKAELDMRSALGEYSINA